MDKIEHSKEHQDLEWMYSSADKTVNHEEYLLGRSVDTSVLPYDPQKNHVEHECIPPSLRDLRTVGDIEQIDAARKLQEDPLFEINRQEIEARKRALQNPVKLKKQLEIVKSRRKSSSSEDDLDKKLVAKLSKLKNSLSTNFHKSVRKNKKNKRKEKCVSDYSDSSETDHKRHTSKSTKSRHKTNADKKYKEQIDGKRKVKKRRSKGRYDSEENTKCERDIENQSLIKNESSKYQSIYDRTEGKDEKYRKKSQFPGVEFEDYQTKSVLEDTDTTKRNYGLVRADGSRIEQVVKKIVKKTSRTQENKKSWVKPEKKKLTEEEKIKKRQEMMSNAEWRDDIRRQTEKNKMTSDKLQLNYDLGAEFLKNQLLKNASYDSIESRIKSNINNIQRSGKDMDRNFARRH